MMGRIGSGPALRVGESTVLVGNGLILAPTVSPSADLVEPFGCESPRII